MYVLSCEIDINGKVFKSVNSVNIKRSVHTLSDSATIKLPKTAIQKKEDKTFQAYDIAETIKVGEKVTIKLGYNGKNNTEFVGFVSKVTTSMPVVIECTDFSYLLTKTSFRKSFKDTTLEEVLKFIIKGIGEVKLSDKCRKMNISYMVLSSKSNGEITALEALRRLRDKYSLAIYFKSDGTLYVGGQYDEKGEDSAYKIGYNTVSDQLKYLDAEERKIKITAESYDKTGQKYKGEFGDSGGANRTIFLFGITDEQKLKEFAEEEVKRYTYSGFEGTLTGFMQPFVQPTDSVNIIDPKFKRDDEKYFVVSSDVTYGTGGGRRVVELGIKL